MPGFDFTIPQTSTGYGIEVAGRLAILAEATNWNSASVVLQYSVDPIGPSMVWHNIVGSSSTADNQFELACGQWSLRAVVTGSPTGLVIGAMKLP